MTWLDVPDAVALEWRAFGFPRQAEVRAPKDLVLRTIGGGPDRSIARIVGGVIDVVLAEKWTGPRSILAFAVRRENEEPSAGRREDQDAITCRHAADPALISRSGPIESKSKFCGAMPLLEHAC